MASLKNSSPEGKASAVQFLKFVFASELVSQFKTLGRKIVVGFDHPNYAHMAVLAEPRARLWPKISTDAGHSIGRGSFH